MINNDCIDHIQIIETRAKTPPDHHLT